jgi:hypothetical protein
VKESLWARLDVWKPSPLFGYVGVSLDYLIDPYEASAGVFC